MGTRWANPCCIPCYEEHENASHRRLGGPWWSSLREASPKVSDSEADPETPNEAADNAAAGLDAGLDADPAPHAGKVEAAADAPTQPAVNGHWQRVKIITEAVAECYGLTVPRVVADVIDSFLPKSEDLVPLAGGILAQGCTDKVMNGWYACYKKPTTTVLASDTAISRKWMFVRKGTIFYAKDNYCLYEERTCRSGCGSRTVYDYQWKLVKNVSNN